MKESEDKPVSLGEYLKSTRYIQGKTLRDVGGAVLSSGYLTQVENGDIQDVTVRKLVLLSDAYRLPIASILSEVYGVDMSIDARAVMIGSAVLALPEDRRDSTIGWIQYQAKHLAK